MGKVVDPIGDVQHMGLLMLATQQWRKRLLETLVKDPTADEYKIAVIVWRTCELETKRCLDWVGIVDPEFKDAEPFDHIAEYGTLKYLEQAVALLDSEYKDKLRGVAVGRLFDTLIAETALNAVRKSLEAVRSEQ